MTANLTKSRLGRVVSAAVALVGCAVVLLSVFASVRSAAGVSESVVTVSGGTMLPGGSLAGSLTVTLAENEDIDAFDVSLLFDPGVVTAVLVVPAEGWDALPVTGTGIDNVQGVVRMVALRQPGSSPCSPSCSLFSVTWFGEAVGRSQLTLDLEGGPVFAHRGQALSGWAVVEGEIIVGLPGESPTPTFSATATTPTPTASAGMLSPTPNPPLVPAAPEPTPTISPTWRARSILVQLAYD